LQSASIVIGELLKSQFFCCCEESVRYSILVKYQFLAKLSNQNKRELGKPT
jgi:hypothetical protein